MSSMVPGPASLKEGSFLVHAYLAFFFFAVKVPFQPITNHGNVSARAIEAANCTSVRTTANLQMSSPSLKTYRTKTTSPGAPQHFKWLI
jgi:hypothetical protein